MNKKILLLSLLSITIIVLLPSIPAVEYKATEDKHKELLENNPIFIFLEKIKNKIKKSDKTNEKDIIQACSINNIHQMVKTIDTDPPAQPQIVLLSLLFFFILIYAIAWVYAIIQTTLNTIIDLFIQTLKKIVNFLISLLKPILKAMIAFLIVYFTAVIIIDIVFLIIFLILSVLPGVSPLYYLV
jgi:hypothetical protein